ncbi:protein-glutamate methylesterase/protein-glutamine glutaminase [Anaerobacillus arseniciselenatis]|uniref:protein-glutamate methylesterase/protein-glutamine glutaminase n=1 Tax=Anaerobacillus arseniciselenatis TaxID=85682 RepID=UPI000ACB31A1|nr:chemotaxis response regulator protein-glutamate methylesterase [Anaerobacillus arseniciselenatis]
MIGNKIKVLIIDDSALVRELLKRILSKDQEIEVVGSTVDPIYAIKKLKEFKPDVITLDLEMPRMDGLTFLRKLMAVIPTPVIIISSRAEKGSEISLKALELGAIDVVLKPSAMLQSSFFDIEEEIIIKVKSAAKVNMTELRKQARKKIASRNEVTPATIQLLQSNTDKIIAIGASTGGTVAIRSILEQLPANLPGILIVLHMPVGFTSSYAESLNASCRLTVKEAVNGELLRKGFAYIAPGGKHILLKKSHQKGYFISLEETPPVNRHRPSVDVLFSSVTREAKNNCIGVILTGMGNDGANGLKEMHDNGAWTIAQDEKTSIVYGMPKQAIKLGAVDEVIPLQEMPNAIVQALQK